MMRHPLLAVAAGLVLAMPLLGQPGKYEEFDKLVAGSKQYDGLFKLHQKDEHLYAELRMDQFDHPYLAPISLAKGGGGWVYAQLR